MRVDAAIFAGGLVGTLLRVGVDRALPADHGWPWATLVVNVAGAALLGWVTTWTPRSASRLAFAGSGVCGALTTFSTLQLETLRLAHDGRSGLAAAYLAVSVAAGVAAAVAASVGARRLRPA